MYYLDRELNLKPPTPEAAIRLKNMFSQNLINLYLNQETIRKNHLPHKKTQLDTRLKVSYNPSHKKQLDCGHSLGVKRMLPKH